MCVCVCVCVYIYTPINTGEVRDISSIPGSGRSPGGNGTHSSILASRIPWAEKPGELDSLRGHKESDTTEKTDTCTHMYPSTP